MPTAQGIHLLNILLTFLSEDYYLFCLLFIFYLINLIFFIFNLFFTFLVEKNYLTLLNFCTCLYRYQYKLEQCFQIKKKKYQKWQDQTLLEQSELLNMGKFAGAMAHDIRNPLTVISLLIDQIKSGKYQQSDLKEMLNKAKRAIDKIDDLTIFNVNYNEKIEADDVFYLSPEIKRIILLCIDRAAEKNIKILMNVKINYQLFAFRRQLNQVISNLLLNAVESYKTSDKNNYIFIKVWRNKFFLLITVKDNGSGIKAKDLKKIFRPHFSRKNMKSNLGLGLYLCQDVMRRYYRSKISVSSIEGQGSEFTIRIKNCFIIGESVKEMP